MLPHRRSISFYSIWLIPLATKTVLTQSQEHPEQSQTRPSPILYWKGRLASFIILPVTTTYLCGELVERAIARTHTVNGTDANYWVGWGRSAHQNVSSAGALTVWAKSSLKFLVSLLFLPVQIQFPTQTKPCCYETVTMSLKNQVIGQTIAEVEDTRTASVLGLGLVAPRANT